MDLNTRDLLTIRRSLRQLRTHNRKGLDLAQQAVEVAAVDVEGLVQVEERRIDVAGVEADPDRGRQVGGAVRVGRRCGRHVRVRAP